MKLSTSEKIREASYKRRWTLRETKGHDYAQELDVLLNFKQVSSILSTLHVDTTVPHGVALMYAILKIQRLCNLVFSRDSKPMNESVQDTIDDLLNYIELMEECLIDKGVIDED